MTPEQLAFLHSQRVAHLGTTDQGGRPHVVPISYACVDDVLYTAIDEKPKQGDPTMVRRVRNILVHPGVCVLLDHYEEDWTRLAWLQVRGEAALVRDAGELARALEALRERYPPYRAMQLESRPLIRITLRQVTSWAASPDAWRGLAGAGG